MPTSATDQGEIFGEPSVAALQAAFAEALLRTHFDVPQPVTATSEGARARRFGVYRNNVYASLTETVRARFPVVERLVGEEFFRAMVRVFIERHPPRSRALLEYGGDFPPFLEIFDPVAPYPYLPDVARLEWLRNVAYHAADKEPIGLGALAAVPPEQLSEVSFELHPSVQYLSSPYPAVSIWATNALDAEVRPIGSNVAAETALIVRRGLEVRILPLMEGVSAFVGAHVEGCTFGAAVERASATAPDFELAQTLAFIFDAGAICAIHTDELPGASSANQEVRI